MTNAKISAAERKKIEALIRRSGKMAKKCRCRGILNAARLLDDLADVAERYLEIIANQPDE